MAVQSGSQAGLTAGQRDRLESIQRRALRLIPGSSDYEMQCALFDIEPIGVRLDNLARSFFLSYLRFRRLSSLFTTK